MSARSVLQKKQILRKKILSRLKHQSPEDRVSKSQKIKDLVMAAPFFNRVSCLMTYLAASDEVDTRLLIEQALKVGKTLILPVCNKRKKEIIPVVLKDMSSLVRGPYGIWEPPMEETNKIPLSKIEVVLVPGLAFDRWGNRLGRGMGYYDRFLRRLTAATIKVGLAFDFQMVDNVPVIEGQDVLLDLIISN
jgi:5-formyltetrahydrofolate cyclo-ligase